MNEYADLVVVSNARHAVDRRALADDIKLGAANERV
jgi:hypothetical protein